MKLFDHLFARPQDRLERARSAGEARGALEAKLFRVSRSGKGPDYFQALEWLQAVVDEGRSELQPQHAFDRELEAWEMSCRIAFMIRLAEWHATPTRR
ncbi:hypothetical protein [Bradyrhizobium sp. BR13661]|jgi:hypothetical protein|uniref:hypothetical protein n=1 Tax=Bradyrhizobium sp. BR13661 TaxID=2940622 RepID=UPI0024757E39|nr:hypothetical protein [Bradyrhizobium sp. BR13661]MDH6263531.1 hypothetical protein [Bradyrhizobium sp. BR13661]